MEKIRTINIGSNHYKGKFSNYQVYGSNLEGVKYGKIEVDHLNDYQNFLYKRALFGLAIYTPEELKFISPAKKARINKVHKRAQVILNIFKQQVTNVISTKFFIFAFPKAETVVKDLFIDGINDFDPEFENKLSLKDLGISKAQVIEKFIINGVLPPSFYSMTAELNK